MESDTARGMAMVKPAAYALVGVVVAFRFVSGCVAPAVADRPADYPAYTGPTSANPVHRGDVGVLEAGESDVFAGASQPALDRLTQLAIAGDREGIAQMTLAGQVLLIKRGTHARLIDPGILSHEVRVLEGEYAGRSAFIPCEYLHGG